MTGYELRRHLAADHDIHSSGLDYAALLGLHDLEHRPGHECTHSHAEDPVGPSPARPGPGRDEGPRDDPGAPHGR